MTIKYGYVFILLTAWLGADAVPFDVAPTIDGAYEDVIKELVQKVQGLEEKAAETDQLRDRVKVLEEELKTGAYTRGRRQVPEVVAFSTVMSSDQTHVPTGNVVKYDNILLNEGGGYDPKTGFFTTPTPGIYTFSYHIGHHGPGETWVELKRNGDVINGVAVEGTAGGQNLQGGNTAILHLDQGDLVWVETFQVSGTFLHNLFTTFSGALLNAM